MQFVSSLRENYQKTSKKQSQKKNTSASTKSSIATKPLTHVCLHHIDSTYSGTVNTSHYRQGFGMIQTINFHTFLGHFKNGKAQGLGLILLNNGSYVYGNFVKDQLNGIGLVDDKKFIKLGVWSKFQLNGIGYEYQYDKYLWRMVRFWKGTVAQVVKEEASDLQRKVPTLLNLEHSLYFFLLNYLEGNFFPSKSCLNNNSKHQQEEPNENDQLPNAQKQLPSKMYCHNQTPRTTYFGLLKSDLQTEIGVKYDKNEKCVVEAGLYENGKLNGFGLKYNCTIRHKEIGMYVQGKKQGLFMHEDSGKISYCLYHQNAFLQTLDISGKQFIKKKQKQFNYSKKSFISQKNTLDLDQYEALIQKICQSKQPFTKIQQSKDTKADLERILGRRDKDEIRNSMLPTKENQTMKFKDSEKTTVSLLKQKFKYFNVIEDENYENEDRELGSIPYSNRRNQHTKQQAKIQAEKKSKQDELRVKWQDQNQNQRLVERQSFGKQSLKESNEDGEQLPIAEEQNPFELNDRIGIHRNLPKSIDNPRPSKRDWIKR